VFSLQNPRPDPLSPPSNRAPPVSRTMAGRTGKLVFPCTSPDVGRCPVGATPPFLLFLKKLEEVDRRHPLPLASCPLAPPITRTVGRLFSKGRTPLNQRDFSLPPRPGSPPSATRRKQPAHPSPKRRGQTSGVELFDGTPPPMTFPLPDPSSPTPTYSSAPLLVP